MAQGDVHWTIWHPLSLELRYHTDCAGRWRGSQKSNRLTIVVFSTDVGHKTFFAGVLILLIEYSISGIKNYMYKCCFFALALAVTSSSRRESFASEELPLVSFVGFDPTSCNFLLQEQVVVSRSLPSFLILDD